VPIPLRWGTKGWGWWHILQGHSYTATDREATITTLDIDTEPTARLAPTNPTNQWVYHSSYEMPDGMGGQINCIRSVVVEFWQDAKAARQGVMGIRGVINSYVGIPVLAP
jgi:hypothetical protein